jgi:hypothetical protein
MKTQLMIHYLNNKIFDLCFTDNPLRKGWELHGLNTNLKLADNKEYHDKYYLIECYSEALTEKETDILYSYADGLSQQFFFNWLNGHCSLATSLKFNFEYFDNMFKEHIQIVRGVAKKRNQFLQANKL